MAFMWKMALPILCILCLVVFSEAFFGSNKEKGRGKDAAAQGNTSLGLVEMAGRLVWERLSKYKFYVSLVTGYKLDEESTVMGLSIFCNILYCALILTGFCVFPRNTMLVIGVLTAAIGPALVLIVLGLIAGLVLLAALYPGVFCFCLWFSAFLGSALVQTVGVALGCDVDGDGDVDYLDLLAYLGRGRLGRMLWLDKLHAHLSTSRLSLLEEINQRFDQLESKTIAHLEARIAASKASSSATPGRI